MRGGGGLQAPPPMVWSPFCGQAADFRTESLGILHGSLWDLLRISLGFLEHLQGFPQDDLYMCFFCNFL